jgi:hypothetical protein
MNHHINGMDRLITQQSMHIKYLTSQLENYNKLTTLLTKDNIQLVEYNKKLVESDKFSTDEKNKIIDQFRCVVCFEKTKTILLEPCLHFATCQGCSEKINKCPICRGEFETRLLVFGE